MTLTVKTSLGLAIMHQENSSQMKISALVLSFCVNWSIENKNQSILYVTWNKWNQIVSATHLRLFQLFIWQILKHRYSPITCLLMTAKMMNIKDALMLVCIQYSDLISLRPYESKFYCSFKLDSGFWFYVHSIPFQNLPQRWRRIFE